MTRTVLAALALTLLSVALAVPAHAVLITVHFTVTGAADDPVNAGVTANGSFSFDSSVVPVGGGEVFNPVVSGFDLTWDGTSWTDANASVSYLAFDAGGDLTTMQLHGNPFGGFMLLNPTVDDFGVYIGGGSLVFDYTREGVDGVGYRGTFSYTVSTGSAPEPASWMLLGGALLGVVGAVRRPSRR